MDDVELRNVSAGPSLDPDALESCGAPLERLSVETACQPHLSLWSLDGTTVVVHDEEGVPHPRGGEVGSPGDEGDLGARSIRKCAKRGQC